MGNQEHTSYTLTPSLSQLRFPTNDPHYHMYSSTYTSEDMHTRPPIIQELQKTPLNTPIWNIASTNFIPTPFQVSSQQSVTGLRLNTIFEGMSNEQTSIQVETQSQSDKEDDATIESNLSNDPKIEPCSAFFKYSY